MTGKIVSAVIVALVLAACFFVIRKRIREIRAGKYCSCSHCDGNCSCCQKKENK